MWFNGDRIPVPEELSRRIFFWNFQKKKVLDMDGGDMCTAV